MAGYAPTHELRWLLTLGGIAEALEGASSVEMMAAVIVDAGRSLGFSRARLFLLDDTGTMLRGAAESGNTGLLGFDQLKFPLAESHYTQQVLVAREPQFFRGEELGGWILESHFADQHFVPPRGEWAHLPLWAGDHCWGILSLDNGPLSDDLRPEQRAMLRVLTRQVATALEHMRLSAAGKHQQAALEGLQRLIASTSDIQQAATLAEVASAIVSGGTRLGFERVRLWMLTEDGQRFIGMEEQGNVGLANFTGFTIPARISPYMRAVLDAYEPIYFHDQELGQSYLHYHYAAAGYSPPTGIWVGIPLRADGFCLGAVILDNSSMPQELSQDQCHLLTLFGHQASLALARARAGYEHTWLEHITELAWRTQQAQTLSHVGQLLIDGAKQLGFERARLWQYDSSDNVLVGVCASEAYGLPTFTSLRVPLAETSYGRSPAPVTRIQVFHALDEGDSYLVRHYGPAGFAPPVGTWVNLPLWDGSSLLGVLCLDNIRQPRVLLPGQRDLLDLFRRHAESAITRIQRAEAERRLLSERDALRLLADVTENVQQVRTLRDVGMAIVEGALRLSFARARLWLLSDSHNELVGFREVGNTGLDGFEGFVLPLVGSRYAYEMLPRRVPTLLHGRDASPAHLDQHFAPHGFQPPRSWLCIPLWGSERCLGMLALDNGCDQPIRPEQHALVDLFGRHAAAALERARNATERDWLRALTNVAADAQQSLGLEETVGRLLHGCTQLGFERVRLWRVSDDGQAVEGFRQVGNRGLGNFQGYRLPLERSPYIRRSLDALAPQVFHGREEGPSDLDLQFAQNGFEAPIGHWVEMGLRVDGQRWGVITLDNACTSRLLSDEERALLPLLHSQITAALERATRYEDELRMARDLDVLAKAERAIAQLVDLTNDFPLWHVLLTTITAPFALDLGCATLLLCEAGGSRLRARMSISRDRHGLLSGDPFPKTRGALSFEEYLRDLKASSQHLSVEHMVPREVVLDLESNISLAAILANNQLAHPLRLAEGQRMRIALPLRDGDRMLGMIVVDDACSFGRSCHALSDQLLQRLQELIVSAMRVREHAIERQAHERLTTLTHMVLADLDDRDLRSILEVICSTARKAAGADSAVLYPLRADSKRAIYDTDLVVADGLTYPLQLSHTPRPDAIAEKVLQLGRVSHVDLEPSLLEQSTLLRREGIQAFQAVAMRNVQSDTQVVLFLNFLHPQPLSRFTWTQAQTFATLAARAIADDRARQRAIAQSRAIGARELQILHDVQKHALVATPASKSQRALIWRCLDAAKQLIGRSDVTVTLILLHPTPSQGAERLRHVRRQYMIDQNGQLAERDSTELELQQGMTARAIATGQSQLAPDVTRAPWAEIFVPGFATNTRSELDVPLKARRRERTIGVFNLESPALEAFRRTHQEQIERLAMVASLALLNLRRQQTLDDALSMATTIGTELRQPDVIRKALDHLQDIFPDARLFMLTYDPVENCLKFAPESRAFYAIDAPTLSRLQRLPLDGPSIAAEVARHALETRRPELLIVPDVSQHPRYLPIHKSTRSKLCVALLRGDQLLGVLGLERDRSHGFSPEDGTLARLVGQQIGLALDRASQSAQRNFATSVAVRMLWASELAHDINSEVGHMRLIIDRLQHQPDISAKARQQLAIVDERAARMAAILDSVRQEGDDHGQCIELHTWLPTVIEGIAMEPVQVVYDFAPNHITVQAPQAVLQRAILHLVRNAREAARSRPQGVLTVRTEVEGHSVAIYFANNGPPIPDDVRARLLNEPFTTKPRPGGLGLIFVRMMMEGMGGTARLLHDEPPGGGATFVLTLPAQERVRERC